MATAPSNRDLTRIKWLACTQVVFTIALGIVALGVKQDNRLTHFLNDGQGPSITYFAIALESRDTHAAQRMLHTLSQQPGVVRSLTSDFVDPFGLGGFPPRDTGTHLIGYFQVWESQSTELVKNTQETLKQWHERHGLQAMIIGDAVINDALDQASQTTRLIFVALLLFALLTCLLFTRSWRSLIVAAAAVLSPLATTMGLYAALGFKLDLLTNLIPVLILVLSLAMHMHVHLAVVRRQNLVAAVRSKLKPNLYVTASTSIGFASLITSDLGPIRTLGIFMAVAVWFTFAWVNAAHLGLGRWLLADYPSPPRFLDWMIVWIAPRSHQPKRVFPIIIAVVLIITAACTLPFLRVQTNGLFYFEANHPVRQATTFFEEHVTGSAILIAEVLKPDGTNATDLQRVRRVEHVRHAFTLPYQPNRVYLTVDAIDSDDYATLTQQIRIAFDSHVTLSGPLAAASTIQQQLLSSLSRSLITSFVLISILIMMLIPRRLGVAIAWIPNLFPLSCMAIAMWAFNIDLSVATVLVFSIAFGIAVDDTVHLTQKYLTTPDGDWQTVVHSEGLAVLTTTLILVIGFLAISGSHFKPLADFGKLLAIGMVAALVGDLWVLPAILNHVKSNQEEPGDPKHR